MTTATTKNNIRPILPAQLPMLQALAQKRAVYIPDGRESLLVGAFPADTADNSTLLGFAAWQRVLDEATLLGIAVAENMDNAGIGRQLLSSSEALLPGIRHAFLEVRAGNKAAQALYRRSGYQEISRRRAYYGNEDALIMRKTFIIGQVC